MIAIVDYGMGNLGSISNMLKRARFKSVITQDASEIAKADKLILPGVGAFDKAVSNIVQLGLWDVLHEKVLVKKCKMLGICLGMQLLAKSSEEGTQEGLGWLDAEIVKFNFDDRPNLKVPHIGWNTVYPEKESEIFSGMTDEEIRFYFVHSFYFKANEHENVVGETEYGFRFASAVQKDNIYGVQFHPEKSHRYGLRLLTNFASL